MFVIKRISKGIIVVFAVGLALLSSLLVAQKYYPEPGSRSASLQYTNHEQFLKKYGWEINSEPIERVETAIPAEFDAVYEKYNSLQKSQGFDLEAYKGKTVLRYSYAIMNYPDNIPNVRANVLVFDGKIIGGDICTVALDGFMHGFENKGTGISKQTFYTQ